MLKLPARRELSIEEKKHKKIALRLTIFLLFLIFMQLIITSLLYSFSDWIAIFLFSILLIVPAYLSNAGMMITGGGKPIDGGKSFKNGQRILGDHKTWNGFIKGPLFIGIPISIGIFVVLFACWGFIESFILTAIQQGIYANYNNISDYSYYFIGGSFPIGFIFMIIRIILCSYGAAFGDLVGSFIKRRFDYPSGAPFWLVDQLDFVSFSLVFVSIPALLLPSVLLPDLNVLIFLLILTPSVSIFANTIAYMIGIKDVPW